MAQSFRDLKVWKKSIELTVLVSGTPYLCWAEVGGKDVYLAVRSDDVFRPGPDLRPQRTERRQEVRAAHGKQERRLARGGHRRFLRSGRWTRTCGHGQEQWEQHGESVAQHLVRMQP